MVENLYDLCSEERPSELEGGTYDLKNFSKAYANLRLSGKQKDSRKIQQERYELGHAINKALEQYADIPKTRVYEAFGVSVTTAKKLVKESQSLEGFAYQFRDTDNFKGLVNPAQRRELGKALNIALAKYDNVPKSKVYEAFGVSRTTAEKLRGALESKVLKVEEVSEVKKGFFGRHPGIRRIAATIALGAFFTGAALGLYSPKKADAFRVQEKPIASSTMNVPMSKDTDLIKYPVKKGSDMQEATSKGFTGVYKYLAKQIPNYDGHNPTRSQLEKLSQHIQQNNPKVKIKNINTWHNVGDSLTIGAGFMYDLVTGEGDETSKTSKTSKSEKERMHTTTFADGTQVTLPYRKFCALSKQRVKKQYASGEIGVTTYTFGDKGIKVKDETGEVKQFKEIPKAIDYINAGEKRDLVLPLGDRIDNSAVRVETTEHPVNENWRGDFLAEYDDNPGSSDEVFGMGEFAPKPTEDNRMEKDLGELARCKPLYDNGQLQENLSYGEGLGLCKDYFLRREGDSETSTTDQVAPRVIPVDSEPIVILPTKTIFKKPEVQAVAEKARVSAPTNLPEGTIPIGDTGANNLPGGSLKALEHVPVQVDSEIDNLSEGKTPSEEEGLTIEYNKEDSD